MALSLSAASSSTSSYRDSSHFRYPKHKHFFKLRAQSEGAAESGATDQQTTSPFSASLPSTRSQLDLLNQLTSGTPSSGYESDGSRSLKPTIREQLVQLVGIREYDDEEFTVPLGKNLKKLSPKFLTISQKRNIKRQSYLNEVSRRNDSVFFATIGAFVILPPFVILGIAVLTGYVQLFP